MNAATLPRRSSSNVDYTLYKYSDLNASSIILQGHLNYLRNRKGFFRNRQFEMYYVVLAEVPVENQNPVMALFLYQDPNKKPTIFFQLNEYERITDQCPTSIESKYFLFALMGKDPKDVEIFGAHNPMEGDKWMKAIAKALQSTNVNRPNLSAPTRRTHKDDRSSLDPTNATVQLNYEPFDYDRQRPTASTNRYAPEPERKSSAEFARPSAPPMELFQRRLSTNLPETNDPAYLGVEESNGEEVHYEQISEDQSFTWKDIFYNNANNDHAEVLNNIGQIGTFLVRPQLQANATNDHQYTLSILAFGGIIKYKIFELRSNRYSLTIDEDEPNFSSIPELCSYYTTHSLPRSTSKSTPKKTSIGDLRLKFPYKSFRQEF